MYSAHAGSIAKIKGGWPSAYAYHTKPYYWGVSTRVNVLMRCMTFRVFSSHHSGCRSRFCSNSGMHPITGHWGTQGMPANFLCDSAWMLICDITQDFCFRSRLPAQTVALRVHIRPAQRVAPLPKRRALPYGCKSVYCFQWDFPRLAVNFAWQTLYWWWKGLGYQTRFGQFAFLLLTPLRMPLL